MQTQRIKVNLVPNADIPERIHVSQYDKGSRAIEFELFDGPIAYSVPDGATVTIQGTKPDNSGFQYECTLSGGTASCVVQGQMTAVAGDVICEIVITKGGSVLGTANFVMCVEPAALSDDTIVSETDMPMVAKAAEAAANAKDLTDAVSEYDKNVQDLSDKVKDIPDQLKTIQSAVSNADASRSAAESAKTAAETAAASASRSADDASKHATEASESAESASGSATAASKSASSASSSASAAASSVTAAANSANSAATSAKSAQDYASKAEISAMPSLEQILSAEFALRRTGKVFATKIYRFASNTTSMGERLRDSVGLTCEPSTDTTVGQDDFITASPIFTYQRCNYTRDDDGTARVTALEGSPTYRTTGACDVGNVYPTFYWACEHHGTYDIYYMSDMPHSELGLIPWCEAVKADGTVLPIYVHSHCSAGVASDGLLRSQPGLVPAWQSYNSMITAFQKKGAGYWGAGSERNLWGMLMLIIKYATKNVQKIFAGHTSTVNMYQVLAYAETGVKRVLIADNSKGFFAGACVSVGTKGNQDPNISTSYDIVNRAKVLSVENVTVNDTAYVALNLDVSATFDTATTYYVKMYPSISGETDAVIGHYDGSYLSNADGKHPFRIMGTEFMWGQAFIESNVVMEKDTNGDWLQYFAPKGTKHVANAHTNYILAGKIPGSTEDYWSGDIDVDTRGIMWPSSKGSSDSLGTGDRVWGPAGGSTGDLRERYTVGHLWNGSGAGLAVVACGVGLSLADWGFGCCD